MAQTLIQNGTIYTMEDGDTVFTGEILVEDGKIKKIGTRIPEEELSGDVEVIDAAGLNVMPGLIEAHSHIGLFDFNGESSVDDANEMTNPVTLSIDARYSVNPQAREFKAAYSHGITTMLLTPGSGNVFCGLPFALKTYGNNVFDMSIKAPCAVKYDADMEAMIPALKREIPCKIHCTQHDMLTAIEVANAYGVRFSLEHAWGASDYIDEIVESGCDVCYGPIGTYRAAGERRKVDIEAVKTLDERGVNVALITDSPILSEESLYHHIGEAVREGVPYLRALRMVTINPAHVLGVEDRVGTLREGKDADLILVKGRPGLDTDASVCKTMIDGKVIWQSVS